MIAKQKEGIYKCKLVSGDVCVHCVQQVDNHFKFTIRVAYEVKVVTSASGRQVKTIVSNQVTAPKREKADHEYVRDRNDDLCGICHEFER